MRRLPPLRSVVAVLLLALVAVPATGRAQGTIPPYEGEELPEGATWEPLAWSGTIPLPAALAPPATSADVALDKITLDPGAGFPIEPDEPPLSLVYVEAGALTIRYPAGVAILATPGAEGRPATQVLYWDTIVIAAGDELVGPLFGGSELRNDGAEPAVLLVLSVVPTGAEGEAPPATATSPAAGDADDVAEPGRTTFDPGEVPDGVRFQPLAFGHVAELPAGPWSLAIARLTAEPGVVFPADESAEVELVAVEAGSVVFTSTGGPPLRVVRGLATTDVLATQGPEPAAEEEVGPGEAATVGAGDGVFVPVGNVAGAEVVGDAPAVALLAFVAPA